jgi:PIN domain nuclease of toxin-antitoxin system
MMPDLLLDTHTFLWWIAGDDSLSLTARAAIQDEQNAIFVSAASTWEISTKHRIGKLPDVSSIVADLDAVIIGQGFTPLPISTRHGQAAGSLPGPHKDPFDRMLIAQAMLNNMLLVSNELPFDTYGVRRLW